MDALKEAFNALKKPMSEVSEVRPGDPEFDRCVELLQEFDVQYQKLMDNIRVTKREDKKRDDKKREEMRRVIDMSGFDIRSLKKLLDDNSDLIMHSNEQIEQYIAEGRVTQLLISVQIMYEEIGGDEEAFDKLINLLTKFEIETDRQKHLWRIVDGVMDGIGSTSRLLTQTPHTRLRATVYSPPTYM
jgi:hypothetical protein